MKLRRTLTTAITTAITTAALTIAATGPAAAGPAITKIAPNVPLLAVQDTHAYEAEKKAIFPIALSKPAPVGGVSVTLKRFHVDTAEVDFVGGAATTVVIPFGKKDATASFPVLEDDEAEAPEQFRVEVVEIEGANVNDGKAFGTLYDADGPVLGVLKAADVQEGDPGDTRSVSFEIEASYGAPEDITFRARTGAVGFGATPGEDFEVVDQQVTLPAGATSTVVEVPIVSDDVHDAGDDGLVMLSIENPSIGSVLNASAVGKILDDDPEGASTGGSTSGGSTSGGSTSGGSTTGGSTTGGSTSGGSTSGTTGSTGGGGSTGAVEPASVTEESTVAEVPFDESAPATDELSNAQEVSDGGSDRTPYVVALILALMAAAAAAAWLVRDRMASSLR